MNWAQFKDSVSQTGLGVWAIFVFWLNFQKNFKHQVQGFYHQVYWQKSVKFIAQIFSITTQKLS